MSGPDDDEGGRGTPVRAGRLLKDKWRLDAPLGVGGVAAVFAATHRNQSRAAIKILRPELAVDPEIRARFLAEGYAANAVGHPGVVQVLDDDQTEDGLVFLVMELLEGETLGQRARRQGGRLSPAEVLPIADAILAVLSAAHDKRIFHRDLKPENVFLTTDGGVKVLDFGLARVHEPSAETRSHTRLGWAMGTPGFMAPEQVRGRWDRVDGRSDLWALGASLFAVLSGKLVHEDHKGEPMLALAQPARSLAEAAPDLPPPVVALVDRALTAEPAHRWQTAAEMRASIAEVQRTLSLPTSLGAPARVEGGAPPSRAGSAGGAAPDLGAAGSGRRPPEPAGNVAAIEIAPGTYWVGKRDPKAIFHANPFLRVFRGAGPLDGAQYNLIVDPGSSSDFAVVSSKLTSIIGGPGQLSGVFVNHQDPDVGSSATVISGRFAPRASIFCSEATWRLIVHANLPRDRFVDTDRAARGIKLPTGHTMIPVPSPFCHFRGAVMLYDPETGVLFSGDLFGGLTSPGAEGIWADESDYSGMRAFHQTYMPTCRAVARVVRAIRRLDPPVQIIAPQHGRLLRGPLLDKMLDRLEALPVGMDLLDDAGDGPDVTTAWSSVVSRILHTARMMMGDGVDALLRDDEELCASLTFDGERVEVKSAGRWTMSKIVDVLTRGRAPMTANAVKLEAILACEELELPSPDLQIEGEQAPTPSV